MQRIKTSIILIVLLNTGVAAQLDPMLNPGDSLFRYTTELNRDIVSFSSINLQYLEFPCVDHFKVKTSGKPNTDIELVTKNYKEFYRREKNTLQYSGFQGPDPFQSRSSQMILFNQALPLGRTYRKDDFYERRSNEFFAVYKPADMDEELRQWTARMGASQLRISGRVTSTHSYKQSDSFDNLDEVIQGFVTETQMVYSVDNIEIKKDNWEDVDMSAHAVLKEQFASFEYRFLSFFAYDSLVEFARIILSPQPAFTFNSRRRLGQHMNCMHSGVSIYIFPNPTFGELKAKFSNADTGTYVFTVSNIIGKRIWEGRMNIERPDQQLPVKLPYLSKGVYLYRITDPSGKLVQSRRLIIVEP